MLDIQVEDALFKGDTQPTGLSEITTKNLAVNPAEITAEHIVVSEDTDVHNTSGDVTGTLRILSSDSGTQKPEDTDKIESKVNEESEHILRILSSSTIRFNFGGDRLNEEERGDNVSMRIAIDEIYMQAIESLEDGINPENIQDLKFLMDEFDSDSMFFENYRERALDTVLRAVNNPDFIPDVKTAIFYLKNSKRNSPTTGFIKSNLVLAKECERLAGESNNSAYLVRAQKYYQNVLKNNLVSGDGLGDLLINLNDSSLICSIYDACVNLRYDQEFQSNVAMNVLVEMSNILHQAGSNITSSKSYNQISLAFLKILNQKSVEELAQNNAYYYMELAVRNLEFTTFIRDEAKLYAKFKELREYIEQKDILESNKTLLEDFGISFEISRFVSQLRDLAGFSKEDISIKSIANQYKKIKYRDQVYFISGNGLRAFSFDEAGMVMGYEDVAISDIVADYNYSTNSNSIYTKFGNLIESTQISVVRQIVEIIRDQVKEEFALPQRPEGAILSIDRIQKRFSNFVKSIFGKGEDKIAKLRIDKFLEQSKKHTLFGKKVSFNIYKERILEKSLEL